MSDYRVWQQADQGISRRSPAIQKLAQVYNSLVADAVKKAQSASFPQALIPAPLNVKKLYNIEANQHMWMVDLLPTDASQLPPYLTDADIRRGMKAVEMKERAKEEMARLQQEHTIVQQWFHQQLSKFQVALGLCHGKFANLPSYGKAKI